MKTFKKLLAVVLSVIMLLSVVVIPASAEDAAATAETTISKYISLLDLSETTLNNKKTGTPSGIANISNFYAANNIENAFKGNQEIIKNADGSRSWKLYFDTETATGSYLESYKKNMIAVKFAIPAEYANMVSAIKLDYTNGVVDGGVTTGDQIFAQFGISDGTDFSAFKQTGSVDISGAGTAEGINAVVEKQVTDLYKLPGSSLLIGKEKNKTTVTEKYTFGTEFAYVYLVMTARKCDGSEGSWATINDIGITITGTEDDLANIATTETYDLLKLDEMELGMVGTDTEFVKGVEEFKIHNPGNGKDYTGAYAGTKEVVEDASGKRALKLDLECGVPFARTATDEQSTRNRIFEGGYHIGGNGTVFMLRAKIPYEHMHLIDSIKIGVDKQTTADVVYAFGITDGKYYSKFGNTSNYYFDGTVTGDISTNLEKLENARVFEGGTVGTHKNDDKVRWGNKEFTYLYVLLSADEAVGYVNINELSYTITATGAEYKKYEGFITEFENRNTGVVTDNAITGEMAYQWSVPAGNAYHTRTITIGGNKNAAKATGYSFWVNNPNSGGEISLKVRIMKADKSVSYFICDYFKVPANSSKRITVDFSHIRIDKKPTDAGASMETAGGDYVALTPEQIAELDTMTVLCRTHNLDGDTTTRDVYVNLDNVKYTFDAPLADATVDLSAATGEGVIVTEDGKLEFAADTITIPGTELEDGTVTEDVTKGSDIIATIPVKDKFFRYGDKLTLNFDNNNTSAVKYKVTLHGTNDSGAEAHWKWGYKDWTRSLNASVTDSAVSLPLSGHTNKYNNNTIHEGTKDTSVCANCNPSTQTGWGGSSGHANNPPSATEKDSITYIQIRVFDNLGSGEKVVLNSISLSYAGNTVTSNVVSGAETGTVNLEKSLAVAGDDIGFFIAPAEMYYVKNIEVVDSKGNVIEYSLNKDYNFDNYYVFKMPSDNVSVKAEFEAITSTVESTVKYDNANDTVKFDYIIPVSGGKAYNANLDAFQSFNNYGVIITSEEALNKYGIDFESLTPEMVAELKASGHHVANYIAVIDSEIDKVNESGFSYEFSIDIENISIRARRAPLLVKNYINFVDGEGVAIPYYDASTDTIDARVYGEYLQTEFNAYYGINVSQVAQGTIDPTNAKVAMALTPEFWQTLQGKGFDHVRFPVDIGEYVDENGVLIEEQMVKIDTMVDNALKAGLCLVFDVHGYNDIKTNFAANRAGFVDTWNQLAERYAHLPLSVAFELINEPRFDKEGEDPMTLEGTMDVQAEILEDIRAVKGNETRLVILSTGINQAHYLDDIKNLEIFNDGYLMMDIHDYSPMTFTNSGIDWNDSYFNEDGTLKYPAGETEYSLEGIQANVDRCIAFTEATGVPCWFGEYGAYKPDAQAEYEYIAGINNILDEAGIGRSMWELWTSWGPYNATKDEWDENLINAIFNPADYLPA